MRELKGKVAFITGGASGIGLAMAKAFGREGMSVMLADIEAAPLKAAVDELRASQVKVEGVIADVTRRDSLRAAALEAMVRFGKIHLVCNNAGVGAGGAIGTIPERDWNWVVDVNLLGVVHGMEIFAPLIASHGEGGHIVNTASMAGFVSPPGMEPYCATKYAVVGMSEGWAAQLEPQNIGVSILCPGFVKTRIHESRRNRPDAYGLDDHAERAAEAAAVSPVLSGIAVEPVAARVVEAVKAGELYVFTHPEFRSLVEARFARVLSAFDTAAASPALVAVAERPAPGAVSKVFVRCPPYENPGRLARRYPRFCPVRGRWLGVSVWRWPSGSEWTGHSQPMAGGRTGALGASRLNCRLRRARVPGRSTVCADRRCVAVFGAWHGAAYSWVGTMISALIGFGLGRLWGARLVDQVHNAKFVQVLGLLARNGFIASLAVRLTPFAPFVAVNMAAGVSPIGLLDFIAGTGLGIVPKILLTAFAGNSIVKGVAGGGLAPVGLLILAASIWIGSGILAGRWLRR